LANRKGKKDDEKKGDRGEITDTVVTKENVGFTRNTGLKTERKGGMESHRKGKSYLNRLERRHDGKMKRTKGGGKKRKDQSRKGLRKLREIRDVWTEAGRWGRKSLEGMGTQGTNTRYGQKRKGVNKRGHMTGWMLKDVLGRKSH